jgi:ribosome-binding protein aMBF1 (putative translation factor)
LSPYLPRLAKTLQVSGRKRYVVPTDDHVDELQRHRWEVGFRIRSLRRSQGLSQVQLAERIGLDHRTVSRAENGVHAISIDQLYRIAGGLGVPSWRLLRDE